ncbi:MAG: hypothetical protein QHI48_02105 [Bacteroidota bacterium]|nr:hypothetical protein [Bacteroidota bacterium]
MIIHRSSARSRLTILIVSAVFALTAGGCGKNDNPLAPHHDHFEAVGIRLSSSGVKLFEYFGPDLTSTNDLGPIPISVGDNGHWEVQFYNEDRSIVPGPDENEKFLVVEIEDVAIAVVIDPHANLRDTPRLVDGWMQYRFRSGVYHFHLQGVSAGGRTRMRIKVFHIDHADFTTLPIVLTVGERPARRLPDWAGDGSAQTSLDDPAIRFSHPAATECRGIVPAIHSASPLISGIPKWSISRSGTVCAAVGDEHTTPSVPWHNLHVTRGVPGILDVHTGLDLTDASMFPWTGRMPGRTAIRFAIPYGCVAERNRLVPFIPMPSPDC